MQKLFKVRCSGIGAIMTDIQGGSPRDRYEKEINNQKTIIEKMNKIQNKELKTYKNLEDKLKISNEEIKKLEKDKDKIMLSETCITYLEERVKSEYYGRERLARSDALDKGTECESEAIYVLNKALGTNYKKTVYAEGDKMENEWCTGHEDIDGGDFTIDTKVSLSFDSFPIIKKWFEKQYWWQGQGYMRLKGENYKKHIVAKVLVNSPERLVKNKLYLEYMNLSKKYEGNEEYFDEEFNENVRKILKSHVFDKQIEINNNGVLLKLEDNEVIPRDKRVKLYEFERDNAAIEKIKRRVEECRMFLKKEGF